MPALPALERVLSRIDPVAAAGFGSAAEVYERARPSYPPESVDWVLARTGVGLGDTIVDEARQVLEPIGLEITRVDDVSLEIQGE